MFGVMRPLVLAAGLLVAFAAPAAASPTWLAPQNLSTPPATGAPSGSLVASDTAGETFATWLLTDGTNQRVQVASHPPGGSWSAATNISDAGADATAPILALSSPGFGAIVWTRSDGAHIRVQVSRRAPGGAFGPADTISDAGTDASNSIAGLDLDGPAVAVDASGDVVVLWEDSTNTVLHSRRYHAATGTWGTITDVATAGTMETISYPALVMSAGGAATAAWSIDDDTSATTHQQVQASTQAANDTWPAGTTISSTPAGDDSQVPQLAIDAAGNVTLVWLQNDVMGCGLFCFNVVSSAIFASTRPAVSQVWQPAQGLSDPLLIASQPSIATTPAGEVTVGWIEPASNAIKVVTRPAGGAFPATGDTTIIAPQDKTLLGGYFFAAPFTTLHLAAGPTGTFAAFARTDGTNNLAEAVFRPAGAPWPNPATTLPTALSAPGADVATFDSPSLALDGLGNAVASWTRGTVIQAAAFDFAPPAFTGVNVPSTGTTGQPVAMSATTLDTWSPLGAGQPSWNFGDGNLGAGGSVSHVFAAPGTYTVTVGASDAVGNASPSTTRQIAITNAPVPPPPPTPPTSVARPKLKAAWKASRLVGTLSLSGTTGASTTLTISVRKHGGKKTAFKSTFKAKSGKWTRTLRLPGSLAPGKYDVVVTGKGVKSSQTSFTLAAPRSGIVARAYATGPRRGPAATTLGSTSELWAHFVFGTLPKKGQTITTQWILPGGKKLGANTRPRISLVEAQVKDLSGKSLPTGVWHCVIRAGGTIVATLNVRLK